MMDMMNSTGWGFGLSFLWGLHVLSVLAVGVGVLFLVLWAVKHLSQAQMKTWGIWLVVAGVVACLLTVGARGGPWTGYGMGGFGYSYMRGDADGMGMSMNGMSMMLRGKTGDDFDRAFIQMMIPHHQGAIDMATLASQNAMHDEIKRLAADIISSQQREIDQMRQWQQAWGYAR